MTHGECVQYAAAWAGRRFHLVMPEMQSLQNNEIPDVLAVDFLGVTLLIECKVSRSDFLADKKKPFRVKPEQGMGQYRMYACPKGMIKKGEIPEGWGLLYVYPSGMARAVVPVLPKYKWAKNDNAFERNMKAEMNCMVSYFLKHGVGSTLTPPGTDEVECTYCANNVQAGCVKGLLHPGMGLTCNEFEKLKV